VQFLQDERLAVQIASEEEAALNKEKDQIDADFLAAGKLQDDLDEQDAASDSDYESEEEPPAKRRKKVIDLSK
jgi:hypothetical protein